MGQIALGLILVPPIWVISALYLVAPWPLKRWFGRSLGALFRCLGLRSQVIRENLLLAYPGESPEVVERRDALYREAYVHLGDLVLELVLHFTSLRSFVSRRSQIRGVEHWTRAKAQGKGVIVLSSHLGNWEVMAAKGALAAGIDIMLVTKRLKPAWLHWIIERSRGVCGVRATYEPRTFKDVLSHLRGNGTVGFVLDQFAGAPVGVRVPFFGVPVGTSTAVATVAKRTGAVVLPVVNYRDPQGVYQIEIQKPLQWIGASGSTDSGAEDLAVNTAHYVSVLEQHIRAHPEQWLWTHRRFKGNLAPLLEGEWKMHRARK